MTKSQTLARIAMALGGRVAEEVVFGEITTGASDDIKRATQLARAMVCELGMSEKLGPIAYGENEENVFLGRDFAQRSRDYSESTARRHRPGNARGSWPSSTTVRIKSSPSIASSSTPWRKRCSSAKRSTPRRSKRSWKDVLCRNAPRS